jgi:hypothetical protein
MSNGNLEIVLVGCDSGSSLLTGGCCSRWLFTQLRTLITLKLTSFNYILLKVGMAIEKVT